MTSILKVDRIEAKESGGNVTFGSPINPDGYSSNYRPGEIIECLAGNADGRSITVTSGTYTLDNVTAEIALTTTDTYITGSGIDYVPPSGTKYVEYRFQYQWDASSTSGITHSKLFIDSTEVQPAYRSIAGGYQGSHHDNWPVEMSWTFDLTATSDDLANGKLASWTTAKRIEVQAREYDNSTYNSIIHHNVWRNQAAADAPFDVNKPSLRISAIA